MATSDNNSMANLLQKIADQQETMRLDIQTIKSTMPKREELDSKASNDTLNDRVVAINTHFSAVENSLAQKPSLDIFNARFTALEQRLFNVEQAPTKGREWSQFLVSGSVGCLGVFIAIVSTLVAVASLVLQHWR